MLYPLKFKPIYKTKVWGGNKIRSIKNDKNVPDNCGESWEISAVQDDISVIKNGYLKNNSLEEVIEIYMGELVGDKVFEKFGYEFPVLLKIIEAKEDLSLQVHPDNDVAAERHNAWGKSELWYIIDAEKDSKIISGFSKNVDYSIMISSLENGTIDQIVNEQDVKPGDAYFIPAGRLHSLGKGITVVEIQQTSDITYRVYDYGRKDRELHLDLAKDVIDYKKTENPGIKFSKLPDQSNPIIKNDLFTVNFLPVMNILSKDYYELDSFVLYYCINGEVNIKCNDEVTSLGKGETVLIPADLKSVVLIPVQYSELLEIYIE
jgi:mannose-6-phosphate isomerase